MKGLYVFAIVPATAPSAIPAEGLCPEEPGVRVIYGDAIAAVVGASPDVDLRALPVREAVVHLLGHQRVVEAIMPETPALPVKFGTVLPSEAAVSDVLARGAGLLAPRLAEFVDRMQLELIVTWSLDTVMSEIADEAEIGRLRTLVADAEAPTVELRAELGQAVKRSIDRRRDAIRMQILDMLRPLVLDVAENALMDDRMIANFALLLPRSAGAAFDDALNALDVALGERLNFRCVGPMPPVSFATVEIDLPSFPAIDEARRTLRLGTSARLADIKSAYRSLLRQTHPDHAAPTPANQRQTAMLTDAYRILLRYVEALPVAGRKPPEPDEDFRFDRDAVGRALRISIHRQASASALEARP